MRLLIDTHVLIWWTQELKRLPKRVQKKLSAQDNDIVVSAVTAWEIAIKVRIGKLDFDRDFLADFDSRISDLGFRSLSLTADHGVTAAALPGPHRDPFDRMLAGQAVVEHMTIVTADPKFKSFGVPVVW